MCQTIHLEFASGHSEHQSIHTKGNIKSTKGSWRILWLFCGWWRRVLQRGALNLRLSKFVINKQGDIKAPLSLSRWLSGFVTRCWQVLVILRLCHEGAPLAEFRVHEHIIIYYLLDSTIWPLSESKISCYCFLDLPTFCLTSVYCVVACSYQSVILYFTFSAYLG